MDSFNLPLMLGPVVFDGFELPAHITVGGVQRMAVHRLADGSRVVDVLGPDESDISWTGILTGPFAAERARVLDELRLRGDRLDLAFGDWFATVLVSSFAANANLAGWVPYRITCTVANEPPEADTVLSDLASLLWPGEPPPFPGLFSDDLGMVVGAAAGLAAAASVRRKG